MSTVQIPPDNSYPLVVGYQYCLAPDAASNNWVTIVEITQRKVRYVGVYPTIADQTVLKTQFDDLVRGWVALGQQFLSTESGDSLITENGDALITEGT